MLCQLRLAQLCCCTDKARTVAAALILGAALTGCSADIMRFDAPALGLGSTASEKSPPPPIHSDGSLFDQRPRTSASATSPPPYSLPPAAAPVERSQLADAAPRLDERRSQRYPSSVSKRPVNQQNIAARSPSRSYTPRQYPNDPPTSGGQGQADQITVQRGDTLYTLSRRHGVSIAALKRANSLTSDTIRPGQILYLNSGARPAPPSASAPRMAPRERDRVIADADTYTVQSGDSLYAISRRTGVRVSELKQLNDIRDVRRMRPGMVLRLRDGNGGFKPSPRAAPNQTRTERYADARPSANAGSTRLQPLSGNKPIILNPKPNQRITEPERSSNARRPTGRTAMRQPVPRANTEPAVKPGADTKFRWPVRGRIIRGFGKRANGTNNDGINIAVPVGTNIHAAEAGTVAYAGNELQGYGNLILLRHAGGYVTAYAHGERILVRRGDEVRRGQVIAKAGKTGSVKQPQVHFELRQGAKPVDPMPYLGRM